MVSGFGDAAVELAARIGDGYWGHSPDAAPVERYRSAGGTAPRYAQINVCWATSEADARKTAHRQWPNAGIKGQLAQDLPTFTHFEQAAEMVTEDDVAGSVACGPDLEPFVESTKRCVDAGYDHVYFHQIGPDQEGFLRFWSDELASALKAL